MSYTRHISLRITSTATFYFNPLCKYLQAHFHGCKYLQP